MFNKIPALTCAAALMMGAASLSAEEAKVTNAQFIEDVGASERINFSGKLRMLSQRIPAAACYSHASVETEASAKMLEAATAEFDQILYALEFGDETLGIKGEEKDRRALTDLKELHTHWDYLHPEIADIIKTGGTDEEVQHIALESHEILTYAKDLVSALVAEHSDPTALLQADALTIDIAGRQRMLAQRISKNVCLIQSGFDVEVAQKELNGARSIYDASARALRHGMPEAGITATDNAEILSKLDDVLAIWEDLQAILDSVKAGEMIGKDQEARVYNAMNSLTGQMNTVVGLYNVESKLGL